MNSSKSNSTKTMGQLSSDRIWFKENSRPDIFSLGKIIDLGEKGPLVQAIDSGEEEEKVYEVEYKCVLPAEKIHTKEVDDCCSLMYLNEATLLYNTQLRYNKTKIYTYIGNILIAVNPYAQLKNLYSKETLTSYAGKSIGVRPPHVFAIADKAFRDMKALRQSQSIIVSGESGAGKTESTKYILKYLCDSYGSGFGELEEKIIQASHILEAFGNAKTMRNNNSSRFGKFIEIHFDRGNQVIGGFISCYLLERARVVSQSAQERNFHIFYQMCAGLSQEMREKLSLWAPSKFRYLSGGCTRFFRAESQDNSGGNLHDGIVDDFKDFVNLEKGLADVGVGEEDKLEIFATIAAILHLGNIEFEESEDSKAGCEVAESTLESLNISANLLNLDAGNLKLALTTRMMQSKSENLQSDSINVHLKPIEAASARDALAKSLYARLFDFIVRRINQSISFQAGKFYIGVLDIAGFEYFAVNGFEQFCINYCNEKLQQFFNTRILKDEQTLYVKEGLGLKTITFVDNQDCIDLVEFKLTGIMNILDEESKLPAPNYEHFTQQIHHLNPAHFRLALPRNSKLKEHRQIRDEHGFIVRHFAGAVCYQTVNFIEKNNDALHTSLEALLQESTSPFVKDLFVSFSDSSKKQGRLNFISVGSKFKKQLGELMSKLSSTGTSFVRCIKPNDKMAAGVFEPNSVFSQLQCSGMAAVLELMQEGFPSRALYSEIYQMYKHYLPKSLESLDPKLFCRALFKALGLNDTDFQFGTSKVFFKTGKFAEFDLIMNTDKENLIHLIEKVKTWLIRSRWRRAQWCALEVIKLKNKIIYRRAALVKLQAGTRMGLARKQHAPRIKGYSKVRLLLGSVLELKTLESSLKSENMTAALELEAEVNIALDKIKKKEKMSQKEINALVATLSASVQQKTRLVKETIENEKRIEEARIKQEKEMEEQRLRQQEIERIKQAKAALEKRRLEEEAKEKEEEQEKERSRLKNEADRLNSEADLQKQLEETEQKYAALQKQMEQERRDHELALRLVAENKKNSFAEPESILLTSSESSLTSPDSNDTRSDVDLGVISATKDAAKKNEYNLSKWKYAELRDTINTSCDINLLEACKEEFHRRLKVYHSWKTKNYKKHESLRAPISLMEEAKRSETSNRTIVQSGNENRYFKVPFLRDSLGDNFFKSTYTQDKGWWLAHFEGQWIRRQIEIHEGKTTIFLKAGVDDIEMCELKLEETGLTRKKGAEILEEEFEEAWSKQML